MELTVSIKTGPLYHIGKVGPFQPGGAALNNDPIYLFRLKSDSWIIEVLINNFVLATLHDDEDYEDYVCEFISKVTLEIKKRFS